MHYLFSVLLFPGVPASTAAATLNATYNDIESVKALFEANKGEIAGVILEPVVGNSGFIVPTKEFLQVRRRGGGVRWGKGGGGEGRGRVTADTLCPLRSSCRQGVG